MTESKNPVRLGDIRTAGLGDEYENISEAYMIKVDVIAYEERFSATMDKRIEFNQNTNK